MRRLIKQICLETNKETKPATFPPQLRRVRTLISKLSLRPSNLKREDHFHLKLRYLINRLLLR